MPALASESSLRLLNTGVVHALHGSVSDRLASIILPVKNGEHDLRELLPRILGQQWEGRLEIVAVDSGSSDGTIDLLREHGATVLAIPAEEFEYGPTRNLAASRARGDVLVFVTTRSLPADDEWLANLVAPIYDDSDMAGVFSRALPRPDADLLTTRDELRWGSLRPDRVVNAIADREAYVALTPEQRQKFLTFHNTSAAIRPAVLARIPFRSVKTAAEDLLWARDVLEAGFKIQYEPSSVVLHSHNYSFTEYLRRSFDDGVGDRDIAGARFEGSTVVKTILATVRDDWHFLEDGCLLRGAELDRWRIASLLRRSARVVGYWLGTSYDANFADAVRSWSTTAATASVSVFESPRFEEVLRAAFGRGRSTRALRGVPFEDTALVPIIAGAVRGAWEGHGGRPVSSDAQAAEDRIATALDRLLDVAGVWLGSNYDDLPDDPLSWLSLIASVRAGRVTQEMRGASSPVPGEGDGPIGGVAPSTPLVRQRLAEPTQFASPRRWHADVAALRNALLAHQREYRAAWAELERRARAMQNLQAQVTERDKLIRDLRARLPAQPLPVPDDPASNTGQGEPGNRFSGEGMQLQGPALDPQFERQRSPNLPSLPNPAGVENAATLTATPNPVPPELGSTLLTWAAGTGRTAQVYVSVDGSPEELFAEASDGAQAAPWIAPGSQYDFRLYDGTERCRVLAETTVRGTPAGGPVGGLNFGDFRRVTPISTAFGLDRGRPIDRYYIERFLARHSSDIAGHVLEIGDDTYTRQFGGARVLRSDVLHVSGGHPGVTIVADLSADPGISSETFDCVIFTQTLQHIYGYPAALRALYRVLKPGGVVLATFPGITRISHDEDEWYWSFTSLSARRLFDEVFPSDQVTVEASGNVLSALASLEGLAAEELDREELDHRDPNYEVSIAVRAMKPGREGSGGPTRHVTTWRSLARQLVPEMRPQQGRVPLLGRPGPTYASIYVSPHLDDVALSCGGAIARARHAGQRVLVVTLCAGMPPSGLELPEWLAAYIGRSIGEPDPRAWVRLRRAEDRVGMAALGVDYRCLEHLDAVFRETRTNYDAESLYGEIHESDGPVIEDLAHTLIDLWRANPRTTFHVPLGVGGHVDHRICFAAGRDLDKAGARVRFYEDFPYVDAEGALERRRCEIGTALVSEAIDISPFLAQRCATIERYQHEMTNLFGTAEEMRRRVQRYSASIREGGAYAERMWRIPSRGRRLERIARAMLGRLGTSTEHHPGERGDDGPGSTAPEGSGASACPTRAALATTQPSR